jgi:ATP-dependent DNA helicase DinG
MIAPADTAYSDFTARISQMFSPGGALAKAANYEYRPQQQEMAAAVASCLQEERHLLVEAGTGVGKSLAYLIPGILFALEHGKKLLVSTHTINLQQQLQNKDLPAAARVLNANFDYAIMIGRANYLCPRRLASVQKNPRDLFSDPQVAELRRISDWAKTTTTGLRHELNPEPDAAVWELVCSERHICTLRTCNPLECFYQRARIFAEHARVLVINHSLFFTLLADREYGENDTGYIFGNDVLILDEAHIIENVAAKHIGVSLSEQGLCNTLHRLYNPGTKKGLLVPLHAGDAAQQICNVENAAHFFFDQLADKLEFKKNDEIRIRHPHIVPDSLSAPLARLGQMLVEVTSKITDQDTRAEILEMTRRINDMRKNLALLLSHSEPDFVYWASITKRIKTRPQLSLHAAPLDLSAHLRAILFRDNAQSILTSATLSTDGQSIDHLARRIGAEDAQQLLLDSPFDYRHQMRILIVDKMPDPRDEDYIPALCREIAHHTARTDGHAFVLFTSNNHLRQAAQILEPLFAKRQHPFLVQGNRIPRDEMLRIFKQTPRAILFGADSFWAGVDVPGEALTNVIITRLPFAPPDDPLTEAKCEAIEAAGRNAFYEYSLPEAILKFRQGAGRLIRSKRDHGTLVILDSRILHKSYGSRFLCALPECPREIVPPAPSWDESVGVSP